MIFVLLVLLSLGRCCVPNEVLVLLAPVRSTRWQHRGTGDIRLPPQSEQRKKSILYDHMSRRSAVVEAEVQQDNKRPRFVQFKDGYL